MFGIIVAFILGMVTAVIGYTLLGKYLSGMSWYEYAAIGELIIEAGHNREATVTLWHDDKLLDVVVLESEEE